MPQTLSPEKLELAKEIQRRRDSMSPERQKIADEIISRAGLTSAVPESATGPSPDPRTAAQVSDDQTNALLNGAGNMVSSIPAAIGTTAKVVYNAAAHPLHNPEGTQMLQGMYQGVLQGAKDLGNTLATTVKGAAGLMPNLASIVTGGGDVNKMDVPAPDDPRWAKAAEFAGANAAGTALGAIPEVYGALKGPGSAVNQAFREKYGYVTPTKNETLAGRTLMGHAGPTVESEFTKTYRAAIDEFKKTEATEMSGPVQSRVDAAAAGKATMNRVYEEEIGKHFDKLGPLDLNPLADKLEAQIPSNFNPEQQRFIKEQIDSYFRRPGKPLLKGRELEDFRQQLRAADKINDMETGYQRAAAVKQPTGWWLDNAAKELRDFVADKVQDATGVNIRPGLEKYGQVSELAQSFEGLPSDKTVVELITGSGSYNSGNAANMRARVAQVTAKALAGNDRAVKSIFAGAPKYDAAAYAAKRAPVGTVGQQLGLTMAGNPAQGNLFQGSGYASRAGLGISQSPIGSFKKKP